LLYYNDILVVVSNNLLVTLVTRKISTTAKRSTEPGLTTYIRSSYIERWQRGHR